VNCCDAYGNCRQGRDCPVRAARLRTKNGGEQVNTDPPVATPEDASLWTVLAQVGAAAFVVLLAVAAFIAIVT
jgi:hypothetical protein